MFPKDFFIRNLDADDLRDNFLMSAIVSVFAIRIFLRVTGYPQLGGGEFHIAHMLWGGFFMLVALIMVFSFLSRETVNAASIVGGIGFGTFIDELGKFITRDNDYFFHPAWAFIYIIFVLIYLALRFIPRIHRISKKEYLVNAIEMIKEAAVNDFDIEEEKQAREYLSHCDPSDPTAQSLTKLLAHIDANPIESPGLIKRFRALLRKLYAEVARSGTLLQGIILFLAIETALTLLHSVTLFVSHPILPFSEWGRLYSSLLAGGFIIVGLLMLRFSKVEAYRFFRIAMLVTIFLTEFFAFMSSQWIELINLAANIFIYTVINYAMTMEKQKVKSAR